MLTLTKKIHFKILKSPAIWIAIGFVAFFLAFYPGAITGTYGGGQLSDVYVDSYRQADILIKSQTAAAIIITGLVIFISGIFLESFIKINNSSINKIVYLSPMPKYKFFLATLLPIFLYSTLFLIFSFCLLLIYDAAGLIAGSTVTVDTFNTGSEVLYANEKNIILWENVQWGYLIYAFILTIALVIVISLTITTFVKSSLAYSTIIWGYVFLIFFFGGASVPLPVIRDYSEIILVEEPLPVFTYISYCIPNTYTNFLFIDAFTGTAGLDQQILLLNTIMPIVFIIFFLILINGKKLVKKYIL